MGKVLNAALESAREQARVEVVVWDKDDIMEVDEHHGQMAALINVMIREHQVMHRELFGDENNDMLGWNRKDLLNWAASGNWFIAALSTGRVVGLANITKQGDDLSLQNFVVDRSARGKGIGHLILNALYQLAQQQECKGVQLGVYANNPKARKLYLSEGFQEMRVIMRKQF